MKYWLNYYLVINSSFVFIVRLHWFWTYWYSEYQNFKSHLWNCKCYNMLIGVGIGGNLHRDKEVNRDQISYVYFCLILSPAQSLTPSRYATNNPVQFNQHSPITYSMQGTVLGTISKMKSKINNSWIVRSFIVQ